MAPRIKAIETRYGGRHYRSRLEARWAVLFDKVGLSYEYEPEGFEFDGIRYLPDFYLCEIDSYVEVKGNPDDIDSAWAKTASFCVAIEKPCYLVLGQPIDMAGVVFLPISEYWGKVVVDIVSAIGMEYDTDRSVNGNHVWADEDDDSCHAGMCGVDFFWLAQAIPGALSPSLHPGPNGMKGAAEAAASARFERF